jgi:hypothetical protein
MKPRLLLAVAALAIGVPANAADTAISIKDPAQFQQQLSEMGYAPDPFDLSTDTPTTVLHLPNETLALVLGGCVQHENCQYVAVVGHFTDVANVPPEWVAKMNVEYDLIKVWTNDDGFLSYSSGAPLDGASRAVFRAWIQSILDSSSDLGSEALKAGYGPKK